MKHSRMCMQARFCKVLRSACGQPDKQRIEDSGGADVQDGRRGRGFERAGCERYSPVACSELNGEGEVWLERLGRRDARGQEKGAATWLCCVFRSCRELLGRTPRVVGWYPHCDHPPQLPSLPVYRV